jgi:Grx4 family monothiol glutaredoxin
MRELAAARPAVTFARVEAEACDELAERYDVSAVPFFTFHRGAEKIDALEGADARALAGRVRQHFGVGGAAAAEPLDARLKRLTTQTPVVLFMKGTRDEPRCGFSRKVVDAVGATGIAFSTFDILSDEDVRQGLKEYSNWPTYPQLYANGELVGGCDIVLEMASDGSLKEALADAAAAAAAAAADAGGGDLNARLAALVKSEPVMLFMKGTRDEPRCGFSRKVVDAVGATGVPFGTFDILSDEDVRQGLKEYSNWPTYPQLYANGELVGGCDIVLEMASDGSLKEALAATVAA